MSPALEQAFGEIEKGAVERLEALRSKKEHMQQGHIEKVEEEDVAEQPEQTEGEHPAAGKAVGSRLMAGKEPNVAGETGGEQMEGMDKDELAKPTDKEKTAQPTDKDESIKHTDKGESVKSMDKAEPSDGSRKKPKSTPSISKLKEKRKWAKIKEQERRWKEATSNGLGEIPTEELDLEEAIISPEESEKQQGSEKEKWERKKVTARCILKLMRRGLNEVRHEQRRGSRKRNAKDRKQH